jgi:uncharacterized membrane protein YkgB
MIQGDTSHIETIQEVRKLTLDTIRLCVMVIFVFIFLLKWNWFFFMIQHKSLWKSKEGD